MSQPVRRAANSSVAYCDHGIRRQKWRAADDIAEVRVSLATLIERVSHLPSKGYIDARLIGMLAAIAALTLFADKIKALIS